MLYYNYCIIIVLLGLVYTLYRTLLSPSYECPHGRINAISVPRRLVPNGDTFSLCTASPSRVFYCVPKYGTVPYGASTVPYSKVLYLYCSVVVKKKNHWAFLYS